MSLKDHLGAIFKRNSRAKQKELIDQCLHKLEDIEDRLSKMQKRERRYAQFLEAMYEELSNKLSSVQSQINADFPFESVYEFSSSFALYTLQNSDHDPDLDRIWNKFKSMLTDLDAELILDQGQSFDDSRHRVCDIRFDPEQPEGTVLEVVQPGIKVQDQLKKPAMVVVNQTSSEKQQ